MRTHYLRSILLLLFSILTACAWSATVKVREPLKTPDGQLVKSIYFFGHWWEPWKSDDAALIKDLKRIKELGFNTICVDHEVSQAIDRDWYWLDREYRASAQEKIYILPWLQLHCMDRQSLMQFARREIKPAVNQDKEVEEGAAVFLDVEFQKALAHYITVYLDRYVNDPAMLKIKLGKRNVPVVGLCVETGWRNARGLPLSFDDETNNYFRKWMRATYETIDRLNAKWQTSYKTFDEIDPCDKSIFNYAFEDKLNMPYPVRDHMVFRGRVIGRALSEVARLVRKKYKDVLFVAEIAYPFSVDNPDANVYRWNDANCYAAVEWADVVVIRTVGNLSVGDVKKEQDMMMLNGKRLILAYRFFGDASSERAVAFAVDCAENAHGIGCYNWNETADNSCALYDKPDRQALARLMNFTYDTLYDTALRTTAPSMQPIQSRTESTSTQSRDDVSPLDHSSTKTPAANENRESASTETTTPSNAGTIPPAPVIPSGQMPSQ